MKTIQYQISFYSYWHAGSGLSGGTKADMLVNKTRENLPYIPGKTLKGLLREAAETIHEYHPELVSQAFIADVFGLGPELPEASREGAEEAKAFFASAYLPDVLQKSIVSASAANGEEVTDLSHYLYSTFSSTKIDERGLAQNKSLRKMEVTVPLTLNGLIEAFPTKDGYETQLDRCMQWVKRLGMNRSRGLGRCQFNIMKQSNA